MALKWKNLSLMCFILQRKFMYLEQLLIELTYFNNFCKPYVLLKKSIAQNLFSMPPMIYFVLI